MNTAEDATSSAANLKHHMTATQFVKFTTALNIDFLRAAEIIRPEEMPRGRDIADVAEMLADALAPCETPAARHAFLSNLAKTARQYA